MPYPIDWVEMFRRGCWVECGTCRGDIEWVDGKDPYWRHTRPEVGGPHPAAPPR